MHQSIRPVRTLLVDDDPVHRFLYSELIQGPILPELVVEVADDGKMALEMLRARPFQLVLTDLMMPGMDGMELLRQVLDEHPEMIVIMLSSAADLRVAVRAMRQGAFSYFNKGEKIDDLHSEIRKAIDTLGLRAKRDSPAPSPPFRHADAAETPLRPATLEHVRRMAENAQIKSVLYQVQGNRTRAARILGITYRQLLNRIKQLAP